MGSTFRQGHSFPASAGFTGSTGKIQNISGYNRALPMPKGPPNVQSAAMPGRGGGLGKLRARTARPPQPGPPVPKPVMTAPIQAVDPGSVLTGGKARRTTQADVSMGGLGGLRAGYRKGGKVGFKKGGKC